MKMKFKGTLLVATAVLSSNLAPGQTNLNFNGIAVTTEGAIRLSWNSTAHEVYEVDYASDIIDTNTGSTTWNLLYDNYPSQGTNTFWLDTGNYTFAPIIPHPKLSSMRFYRIVKKESDTTSDEPSVTITSPTNNAVASGELTITAVASTDQAFLVGTKLYVDGQEMRSAAATTNYSDGSTNYQADTYTINTCEWENGSHILFATVECRSANTVARNSGPIFTGHGVSPFVPIIFSNLITKIAFSQPSFNPSAGQTQQVSAVFAANSDWTLRIADLYSNVVLTVTGSGDSMVYDWNGTGNGGTNLPTGIYYYYISAKTNGLPLSPSAAGGESSSSFASAASPDDASDATCLWVQQDDGSVVPLALFPPGINTNGFDIFEAPSLWNPWERVFSSESVTFMNSGSGGSGAGPAFGGPTTQAAPAAPQRPDNNPVMGIQGTFGVAADNYNANGTNGITLGTLLDGSLAGSHIEFEGDSTSTTTPTTFVQLSSHKTIANTFIKEMGTWGWNNTLFKMDDALNINDLKGVGSPFNNVNLALLLLHSTYGTSIDYKANECKQMYFPITSGGGGQYLRMSEMNLGGAGTNGLKWLAMDACHSLYHVNWTSMKNAGVKPYNTSLHLLLGADTSTYPVPTFERYWAQYINVGTNIATPSPLTLRAAWYQAATNAYRIYHSLPSGETAAVMAVAGDTACREDTIQGTNSPTGTWFYETNLVWSPP